MSLDLPLYLYRNINQAPELGLNALASYTQGCSYLKSKAIHFLNTCEIQLQNTFNAVYPILRHPRRSTISAVLFSTKCIANLTGMGRIYQKGCHLLSKRARQLTSVENRLLVKLKKLSNYCEQLNTRYIPWQKIPELQVLEELKEELLNSQHLDNPNREKIAEAISCCNDIHALVTLHYHISTTDLSAEEIHNIEENATPILSAIEENMGEAIGSYTPSLLAPILNDLLNAIPKSYNPLVLASNSLMTSLKKISLTVGSASVLSITSSNYFVSANAQKTLIQLCAISGMSTIGLYYQEQIEETAKEVLKIFLEINCAYVGMLLFKTDEFFKDYFHKIIPATAASKATEYYLDSIESSTITSFVLPLLMSSLIYNQAFIQKSYQQLKTSYIYIFNGEAKRQFLQSITSLITDQIINSSSNRVSLLALKRAIKQICHSQLEEQLASAILLMNPHIRDQPLNNIFAPLFLPVINLLLAQPVEHQVQQSLKLLIDKSTILLKEYLTILQQDDMQELLLRIQQKFSELDPEVEELKNQFLRDIFFKKTGILLPLDNLLDLLRKSLILDIQASLFTSFKDAPSAIQMLWNSYPFDKKVERTLTLELLLQGFIVTCLANLVPESNAIEPLNSFSYVDAAYLGINLVL